MLARSKSAGVDVRPSEGEGRPRTGPASATPNNPTEHEFTASPAVAGSVSQQVSWWETHRFIETVLAQANAVGPLPWAGSPEWCELADGDPRKLLALAIAGEHHILRVEVAQTAHAEASRAISDAADWSEVSRTICRRSGVYIPREVA